MVRRTVKGMADRILFRVLNYVRFFQVQQHNITEVYRNCGKWYTIISTGYKYSFSTAAPSDGLRGHGRPVPEASDTIRQVCRARCRGLDHHAGSDVYPAEGLYDIDSRMQCHRTPASVCYHRCPICLPTSLGVP